MPMWVRATALTAAKSDAENQDAVSADSGLGLFAIADGAGTTVFADVWAGILARTFTSAPLLSAHPMEVKWWLEGPQREFERSVAASGRHTWNVANKLKLEGSQAAFLGARVREAGEDVARVRLVGFGDCCAFHLREGRLASVPSRSRAELDRSPICLPSKARLFAHTFHRGVEAELDLKAGDTLYLATDAVARWVFDAVLRDDGAQTDAIPELDAPSWLAWVDARRSREEMADDDSTLLVIACFGADPGGGTELGSTKTLPAALIEDRRQQYEAARAEGRLTDMARLWGDGDALKGPGVSPPPNLDDCQAAADAADQIRLVLRRNPKDPDRDELAVRWHQHALLLSADPGERKLVARLAALGVVSDAISPVDEITAAGASSPAVEAPNGEPVT